MLILYLKQYSHARKLGILSGFSSRLFAVKYDKAIDKFQTIFSHCCWKDIVWTSHATDSPWKPPWDIKFQDMLECQFSQKCKSEDTYQSSWKHQKTSSITGWISAFVYNTILLIISLLKNNWKASACVFTYFATPLGPCYLFIMFPASRTVF